MRQVSETVMKRGSVAVWSEVALTIGALAETRLAKNPRKNERRRWGADLSEVEVEKVEVMTSTASSCWTRPTVRAHGTGMEALMEVALPAGGCGCASKEEKGRV